MRFAARACAALLALQLASAWSLQRPSLLGGGKANAEPTTDDAAPADARRRLASAPPTITFAEPDGPPPELDLEVLKPGPLPKISFEGWEKPELPALQKPEFDKPEPKQPLKITLVKPQKPNITWTAVTPPPQNWTIRPPEKVKGNVTIVKTKVFENVTKQVNVSKPAWNVNVTVVKGQKPDVRPYWQKPSANISITKFDKWTGYNFTYQKPPTNFSITLQKPGKPKWGKEDGVFVKTEETKGVTINGTLEPPIMVGPVDDIIGERFVCVFPKGSEDWTTSFPKKVPAGLADAVAAKDPNSFIAPPYGVKAFGPGCMTYDWMCRTNFGVPCSGHGVCESSQPNRCLCFAGYRNCLPPGMSNGCETNTYADNKNCLGCGYNFKTSTVNPQFICGNGTICCGLAGCVTPAMCNTTAATNATSLRTSIYPTPISAIKSPNGVPVSPPGDGAGGAGSVATPTDPAAAGGDPGAASPPPPPPPADGGGRRPRRRPRLGAADRRGPRPSRHHPGRPRRHVGRRSARRARGGGRARRGVRRRPGRRGRRRRRRRQRAAHGAGGRQPGRRRGRVRRRRDCGGRGCAAGRQARRRVRRRRAARAHACGWRGRHVQRVM